MLNINEDNVRKLLVNYSKETGDKVPLLEDGNLDVNKLQTLPETIDTIAALKKEGLEKSGDLFKLGFPAAGMILKF